MIVTLDPTVPLLHFGGKSGANYVTVAFWLVIWAHSAPVTIWLVTYVLMVPTVTFQFGLKLATNVPLLHFG